MKLKFYSLSIFPIKFFSTDDMIKSFGYEEIILSESDNKKEIFISYYLR